MLIRFCSVSTPKKYKIDLRPKHLFIRREFASHPFVNTWRGVLTEWGVPEMGFIRRGFPVHRKTKLSMGLSFGRLVLMALGSDSYQPITSVKVETSYLSRVRKWMLCQWILKKTAKNSAMANKDRWVHSCPINLSPFMRALKRRQFDGHWGLS